MILKPNATTEQQTAINEVLNKSITFGEVEISDQEIIDYIQGKLDRLNKKGLFVKQIRASLKFVVRKKKPEYMTTSHYGSLINKVLKDNGYGK